MKTELKLYGNSGYWQASGISSGPALFARIKSNIQGQKYEYFVILEFFLNSKWSIPYLLNEDGIKVLMKRGYCGYLS